MKKLLVIGIIFLFLGVSLAPSINQSVVTASQEDDLVEVTTQACGIKGYKDTTVKLTREQYQNLKEYLVEFRARLNQTLTREEAIPIFKEAVVELNKYGLLPKRMSVKQAQNLVTRLVQNRNIMMRQNRFLSNEMVATEDLYNFICLIGGHTDKTIFENIGAIFFYLVQANFLHRVYDIIYKIFHVESLVVMGMAFLCYATFVILSILCMSIPLAVMNRINIGYRTNLEIPTPANGWVTTIGLFGNKRFKVVTY